MTKNKHKQHLKHGGFLPWLPNLKMSQPTPNKLAQCVCGKWTGWLPPEVHSTLPDFDFEYEILGKPAPVSRKSQVNVPVANRVPDFSVSPVEIPVAIASVRKCLKMPTGELYSFNQHVIPAVYNDWAKALNAEIVEVEGFDVWYPNV